MGRLEKTIVSVIAIILLLLLGLLLLPSLRQVVVYRVSVFIEGADDKQIATIWHGMEQSAVDFNIDIKFINITDRNTAVLDREIDNGVDAFVVSTFPGGAIADWLDANTINIPVISLGQAIQSENITAHIGAKEEDIGDALGKQVAKNNLSNIDVTIVSENLIEQQIRFIALYDYLAAGNINYTVTSIANLDTTFFEDSIRLMVSIDNNVTEALCDFVGESQFPHQIIAFDYTGKTLSYLESGEIICLVVQSQYELGYIAIESTVAVINGEKISDRPIDLFVATKENMYGEMSSILFPIY